MRTASHHPLLKARRSSPLRRAASFPAPFFRRSPWRRPSPGLSPEAPDESLVASRNVLAEAALRRIGSASSTPAARIWQLESGSSTPIAPRAACCMLHHAFSITSHAVSFWSCRSLWPSGHAARYSFRGAGCHFFGRMLRSGRAHPPSRLSNRTRMPVFGTNVAHFRAFIRSGRRRAQHSTDFLAFQREIRNRGGGATRHRRGKGVSWRTRQPRRNDRRPLA